MKKSGSEKISTKKLNEQRLEQRVAGLKFFKPREEYNTNQCPRIKHIRDHGAQLIAQHNQKNEFHEGNHYVPTAKLLTHRSSKVCKRTQPKLFKLRQKRRADFNTNSE